MKYIQRSVFIVLAYVMCHGLTAWIITPVQQNFLGHITVFASLMYLPHGVRVLATWLYGWRAVPPLFIGGLISEYLFTPADVAAILEPMLLESIMFGACSAFLAFELIRLLGRDLYSSAPQSMNWKGILLVGAISSLVNSVGQSFIYSGLIFPEEAGMVLLTYAIGDMVGLCVTMFALMMIFRWIRLSGRTNA